MGCCCCKSAENGPEIDPLTEQVSETNESDKNMVKDKVLTIEPKSMNKTQEEFVPEEGTTEEENVQSIQEDQQKDNLEIVASNNSTNDTDVVLKLQDTLRNEEDDESSPEKQASIGEAKRSVTPNSSTGGKME